jgi:O-antigen ligase
MAAWLVPLHVPPWVTSQSEMLAALSVGLLALACLVQRRTAPRVAPPAPAVFLAAIALVPLVQVALGQIVFAGDGWVAGLYLACAASAVVWSTVMAKVDLERWSRTLATATFAGALLSAIVLLLQRFDVVPGAVRMYVTEVRPGYPPGANLSQPNQLATLLGLGLAGLMLLFEQGRVRAVPAFAAAGVLTLAMAATQSRTPVLLFAAALVTLALLRRRLSLRTGPAAAAGLAAVWAAGVVAWPRFVAALDLLPLSASLASRVRPGARTVIWQQIAEAIWLRPWTGYGWNQVSNAQLAVIASYPDSRQIEHSHSLPLDLLIWNGVPLGLLIIGLTLAWLWRMQLRVRSAGGAFGLLTILLLLTHALVEFPLEYLYFLVPFAMAIGIVCADTGSGMRLSLPRWAAALLATAHIGLLAWASIDYMDVESEYREMRYAVARLGQPMPSKPPPLLQTQFTQLAAQHRLWLSTPRAGMSAQELQLFAEVSDRFGYAPLIYRHALAQALNGDIPGARAALLRLRYVHQPQYIQAAMGEIRRLAETEHPELRALLQP